MAKFRCACGKELRIKGDEPHEYCILQNSLIADMASFMDKNTVDGDYLFDKIQEHEMRAYICPHCKRITIDEGSRLVVYSIEKVID